MPLASAIRVLGILILLQSWQTHAAEKRYSGVDADDVLLVVGTNAEKSDDLSDRNITPRNAVPAVMIVLSLDNLDERKAAELKAILQAEVSNGGELDEELVRSIRGTLKEEVERGQVLIKQGSIIATKVKSSIEVLQLARTKGTIRTSNGDNRTKGTIRTNNGDNRKKDWSNDPYSEVLISGRDPVVLKILCDQDCDITKEFGINLQQGVRTVGAGVITDIIE